MDTRQSPAIVVTANTKTQLDTKTWRELSKWHDIAVTNHWHTWTATSYYKNDFPGNWKASAIPWSKDRPQAFAGTHDKDVLMLYDEASEIPDIIFETSMGAMTTKGAMMILFGNPTRNTGTFRECFFSQKERWFTRQIDSRTAKAVTNKQEIDDLIHFL